MPIQGSGPWARYIGLMSGTSMDGVDALLLEVRGSDPRAMDWRVAGFVTTPWSEAMQAQIRQGFVGGETRALARLHVALAEGFADAVHALLNETGVAPGDVRAIGSHGQTVWHEPPHRTAENRTAEKRTGEKRIGEKRTGEGAGGAVGRSSRGMTLQLGDPATLAERTGIAVVSDFRARDMAAGGEGAPLVPWADLVMLHRPGVSRALQNLGGMGNVTYLPATGDPIEVQAFDTGPGVALLDAAARRASGGHDPWDQDGRRALRGRVIPDLLDRCLAHPFFELTPPRSTGRETFGDPYLEALLAHSPCHTEAEWDDLLATLTALTAQSVSRSLRAHLPFSSLSSLVLSGGGARNPALVQAIAEAVDPLPVETGAEALGIDPDAREAAAFALLAWAHEHSIPGNLPQVTGASGPRVLGQWTPGPAPVTRS
jgi:anhydro-N-acetylmuramic acid kinase